MKKYMYFVMFRVSDYQSKCVILHFCHADFQGLWSGVAHGLPSTLGVATGYEQCVECRC